MNVRQVPARPLRANLVGNTAFSDGASGNIGETALRQMFTSKNNELFIQQTEDLDRWQRMYEQSFSEKRARRDGRFSARLARAGGRYECIPSVEYRDFGKKGFPRNERHLIFAHLLNLNDFELKYGIDYFDRCLRLDIPSSVGRVIQVDIPRTLSWFASVCGEETKSFLMKQLRDVLWAFAVHKPEIGYCQSLNFIAAYFLTVFGSSKISFYALVQLIDSPTSPYVGIHTPGYYSPGMKQLLVDIEVLEKLTRIRVGDSEYRNFFEKREISNLSMIVSEWFHTLFVTVFPIRTVDRIFDLIVSGSAGSNKIIFRIAFTILRHLISRKDELYDLDQVMQGHKRITKLWVDANSLIVASTRGMRRFSKKQLEAWKLERRVLLGASSSGGSSTLLVGNTMMKLDEAIAPSTTLLLVPTTVFEESTILDENL